MKKITFSFLLLIAASFISAGSPEEWKQSFQKAEAAFNSRSEYSCVPLFLDLIAQITLEMKTRDLSGEELDLLEKSLDDLGQAYYDHNEQDKARDTFLKLIEVNPAYEMNADLASPKIVRLLADLKQKNLGALSISISPKEAAVTLDGRKAGTTVLHNIAVIQGKHVVEVSSPGYATDTRSVTVVAGGTQQLQFSLRINPEISEFYQKGLDNLRLLNGSDARSALSKAVLMNSQDALVLSALGETDLLLGYEKEAQETARKAQELAVNLARDEKLLVEARYHEALFEWDEAIRIYKELFESSKKDLERGVQLALAQIRAGRGEDAFKTLSILETTSGSVPRLDLLAAMAADQKQDFQKQLSAAEKAHGAESASLVAGANLQMARAYLGLGDLTKAIAAFDDAEKAYGAHTIEYALAQIGKGDVSMLQKETSNALKKYDEALNTSLEIGNRTTAALAMYKKGLAFQEKHNLADARRIYESARDLLKETHLNLISSVELQIGKILEETGDPSGARKRYEQSLEWARKAQFEEGAASALLSLGQLHGADAKDHLVEALEIYRRRQDERGTAQALFELGNVMQYLNDASSAKSHYEEGLALFRETGDQRDAAKSLRQIGELLADQNDKTGTADRFGEALKIFQAIGDQDSAAEVQTELNGMMVTDQSQVVALLQRGFDHLNGMDYAAARQDYLEARAGARNIGDLSAQANALNSLGFIALNQKKSGEAKGYWEQALKLARQSEDKSAQALALYNLSTFQILMGNETEATSLYEQSVALYIAIGANPRPRPW